MTTFSKARFTPLKACSVLLLGPLLLPCNQAIAQDDPEFIILGPALSPEYHGSEDYETVPMLVSKFNLLGTQFEIEGLTARADLLEHNNWKIGVTTEFDFGRDGDVENASVAQMTEIDSALNLGAFLSKEIPNVYLEGDNLTFRVALFNDVSNTHEGRYSRLATAYELPLMLPFKVEFELETTYADADYMNTYFGVNAQDAASSGFYQYQADRSFRDVTFNTNIGVFTSPDWGGFLRLGVTKLLADAVDSPIVKAGDDIQYFVGLGVFYRLGE